MSLDAARCTPLQQRRSNGDTETVCAWSTECDQCWKQMHECARQHDTCGVLSNLVLLCVALQVNDSGRLPSASGQTLLCIEDRLRASDSPIRLLAHAPSQENAPFCVFPVVAQNNNSDESETDGTDVVVTYEPREYVLFVHLEDDESFRDALHSAGWPSAAANRSALHQSGFPSIKTDCL